MADNIGAQPAQQQQRPEARNGIQVNPRDRLFHAMGYSILYPYRGMEVKFQGGHWEKFPGGLSNKKEIFQRGNSIDKEIFQGDLIIHFQ